MYVSATVDQSSCACACYGRGRMVDSQLGDDTTTCATNQNAAPSSIKHLIALKSKKVMYVRPQNLPKRITYPKPPRTHHSLSTTAARAALIMHLQAH